MKQLIIVILSFLGLNTATAQNIRYVKTDGTTPASGAAQATSWNFACADLQAVINSSDSGDMIWVAKGIYLPIHPADTLSNTDSCNQNNAFVLKKDIKIYGGFAGTETVLTERNWELHKTVLSGDIGISGDSTDNCYHVIISAGEAGAACLDGFTITEGVANYSSSMRTSSFHIDSIAVNGIFVYSDCGGGIYNTYSSPKLRNITVTGNSAYTGGGIYNTRSLAIFTNVDISKNSACIGGGMRNTFSSIELFHVTVSDNSAAVIAGGICNHVSSPRLAEVVISGNSSEEIAGGIFNADSSAPRLINWN